MTDEPKIPAPPEAEPKPQQDDPLAALLKLLVGEVKPPTLDDLMRRQIDDGRRIMRVEKMLAERGDKSLDWTASVNRVGERVAEIEVERLQRNRDTDLRLQALEAEVKRARDFANGACIGAAVALFLIALVVWSLN